MLGAIRRLVQNRADRADHADQGTENAGVMSVAGRSAEATTPVRDDPTADRADQEPDQRGPAEEAHGERDTGEVVRVVRAVRAHLNNIANGPDLPSFEAATTTPAAHWRAVAATHPDAGLVGLFGSALAGALVLAADEWEAADHDDQPAAVEAYAAAWGRAVAGRVLPPVVTPSPAGGTRETSAMAKTMRTATVAPAPTWDEPTAGPVAWLATVTPADLPSVVELRPGVVVTDPARFVAALRADVAAGPGTIRTGRGLLARDLADMSRSLASAKKCKPGATAKRPATGGFRDINAATREAKLHRSAAGDPWPKVADPARDAADGAAPEAEAGQPSPAAPQCAPDGTSATPAEHLAELGGHAGAVARYGWAPALAMWDAARLAERDRGTDREARWTSQYWRAWEQAQMGGCS